MLSSIIETKRHDLSMRWFLRGCTLAFFLLSSDFCKRSIGHRPYVNQRQQVPPPRPLRHVCMGNLSFLFFFLPLFSPLSFWQHVSFLSTLFCRRRVFLPVWGVLCRDTLILPSTVRACGERERENVCVCVCVCARACICVYVRVCVICRIEACVPCWLTLNREHNT